jgi:hypothetical protein
MNETSDRMTLGMKISLGVFALLAALALWGFVAEAAYCFQHGLPQHPGLFFVGAALQTFKLAVPALAFWGVWRRRSYGKWLSVVIICGVGAVTEYISIADLRIYLFNLPEPHEAFPLTNDSQKFGGAMTSMAFVILMPWLCWKWTGVFARTKTAQLYFAASQ